MQNIALGRFGRRVSRIGLGCMGMADFCGPADEADSIATIPAALDAGITRNVDCVCGFTRRRQRWDNPTMILTLDAKRRLTVPAALAPAQPGDHFISEFDPDEDTILFRRIAKHADRLAVLKACRVPMDDLPPRSHELPKRLTLRAGSSTPTSSVSRPRRTATVA